MSIRIFGATTVRILLQLRQDHRTVAMILLVPSLLMILLYFLYQDVPTPPGQVSLFQR
ncbi:ABC transporter permease, partial [Rhodococcus erythropolis]|nr:ABC transporter permease [Rhodococcus erythropolis]